ncbi:malto-oligosyltrehalose trehalohydrolase [Tateyamaria pelophila]|uniref:malto-oligosyltrehalose trehalohydrolase n=1 Tax=Tateyamaria pelophila TaxID=328415 RepID=UPI001CBDAAC3|nr:malto-oligosyltrehalose trehalohydrolase [Tateyamaria pelophila]
MNETRTITRMPFSWGPERISECEWSVSIWAPGAMTVVLEMQAARIAMDPAGDSLYTAVFTAKENAPYRFRINGEAFPDPASRQQLGGVHGWSVLTAPVEVAPWSGREWQQAVIYEMHIGTFTTEGTFKAAATRLTELAALGITVIEIMPIAQFSGNRGWGYDGVLPYAVHPDYGTREDFAAFVQTAHQLGLSVILDVVYNHFGPDGSYMHAIAPTFFDDNRNTPWGPAIDFSQEPVRRFFIDNAIMWIEEFCVDGLRIDAARQILDHSQPDFLENLCAEIRERDFGRQIHVVTEDESSRPDLRERGLVDAQWNDDYHHAVHCLLTGERAGYYRTFAADPLGHLASALATSHVEHGQPRDGPRGASSDHLPMTAFVNANQTHDQIGNRALGERLISLVEPEAARIVHALLLCAPAIPMLFMGEEAGARSPFLYFTGFEGDLAEAVRVGRQAEFAVFDGFGGKVPDPHDPEVL